MESRVNKYYTKENEKEVTSYSTRSSRNAKLYRHIYNEYDNSDNLPLEDNINEIDIEKLKELVAKNSSSKEQKQIKENLNILEQRKRRIDEQKLYDINKILEKAKYENNKLKTPVATTNKIRKDLLYTLESTELSIDEINEAKKHYQEQFNKNNNSKEEELSMTRELKYKNLNLEQPAKDLVEKESLVSTNSLSLDLFAELKPTGNTIITEPIKKDTIKIEPIKNTAKSDIYSSDTSDIDIIKNSPNSTSNDFFTSSYEFSKKDFADNDDDDFFDTPKKGGLFKILLLILAIVIFVGVIIYFVGTYGLGIS